MSTYHSRSIGRFQVVLLGYAWFFVDALMVMGLALTSCVADMEALRLGRTGKHGNDGCLQMPGH
jgi:hypothetical protein